MVTTEKNWKIIKKERIGKIELALGYSKLDKAHIIKVNDEEKQLEAGGNATETQKHGPFLNLEKAEEYFEKLKKYYLSILT